MLLSIFFITHDLNPNQVGVRKIFHVRNFLDSKCVLLVWVLVKFFTTGNKKF